jgi:putative effector of murein hydrolase
MISVDSIQDDMVAALYSLYIPACMALALPVFAALAWMKGWWNILIRAHYTVATLGVIAGIWWVYYWNLLG